MGTRRRAGSTEVTHQGLDCIAGTPAPTRAKQGRPRDDGLAAGDPAESLAVGAEEDPRTPMSDQQLDQRDRKQSAKRKTSGPTHPESPTATPVAPPPSAPPPSDPE
ncbi:MAG: hypothetical protein ABIU87_01520 [Ornithinibacter sp.]